MSPILLESHLAHTIDVDAYRTHLISILSQLGTLQGDADKTLVGLLTQARQDVIDAVLTVNPGSATLYQKALAGIDETILRMNTELGVNIADWQAKGFDLGTKFAIPPEPSLGFGLVGAGVATTQLEILGSYSADLVQDITSTTRKQINGALASVMLGAQTPFEAARKIGGNLTDLNHFTSLAHRARAITVTEIGRAHSLGTHAGQTELARLIKATGDPSVVNKRWINAHLPGARQTHLEAEARYHPDGAVGPIPVDQHYEVGGFKALYPKDPALPASETVNCHCISITVITDPVAMPTEPAPFTADWTALTPTQTKAAAMAAPGDVEKLKQAYSTPLPKAVTKPKPPTPTPPAPLSPATKFLVDPWGGAGLEPLKTLKSGGTGYGGKPISQTLGYPDPKKSGLVWDSDLGAWKHAKATAGQQLPAFADLTAAEQLAVMNKAGLPLADQIAVLQKVDANPGDWAPHMLTDQGKDWLLDKPGYTPFADLPATDKAIIDGAIKGGGTLNIKAKLAAADLPKVPDVPNIPPPVPAPAPKPKPKPTRALPSDGQKRAPLKPAFVPPHTTAAAWTPGKPGAPPTKKFAKPTLRKGNYVQRIKEVTGLSTATPGSSEARHLVKEAIMRDLAVRLEKRVAQADVTEFYNAWRGQFGFRSGAGFNDFERVAAELISTWAGTSGDHHPGALTLQRAAAHRFGLPWPPLGYKASTVFDEAVAAADKFGAKWDRVTHAFLDSMYEATQEELARLYPGDGPIRMARGMTLGDFNQRSRPQMADVALNPLSSFAIETAAAKKFGGTLIYVDIPRERILGSSLSGYGCLNEYEFVVIGAPEAEAVSLVGKAF